MKNDSRKLQNEELKDVNGGGTCTHYSSESYDSLGIGHDHTQLGGYHPVITTLFNTCDYTEQGDCEWCGQMHKSGLSCYCGYRSQEKDPYK